MPQLWSVLKGDMSLVGPRPPLQEEYERFNAWQRQKLVASSRGLLASGRCPVATTSRDFDDWVRLDLEYIRNWSLWLDVKILLRTAIAVVSGRGAS